MDWAVVEAGSALYQLIYSSILIITAFLRRCITGKTLTVDQWIGCVIVTLGLGITSFGTVSGTSGADVSLGEEFDWQTTLRSYQAYFLCILTTFIYALEYVIIEMLMTRDDAPAAQHVCSKVGSYGLSLFSLYTLVFVIPNWNELMIQSVL